LNDLPFFKNFEPMNKPIFMNIMIDDKNFKVLINSKDSLVQIKSKIEQYL